MKTTLFAAHRIFFISKHFIVIFFLLFLSFSSRGIVPSQCLASESQQINFDSIQGKIKEISRQIKNISTSRQDIEEAKDQTEIFLKDANECIEASTAQINGIDQDLLSLGPADEHEPAVTGKERKRLNREKQTQQVRMSECRLITTLSLRLKNELADWDKLRQKADFFSKTENFYNRIWKSLPSFTDFRNQARKYLLGQSGIQNVSVVEAVLLLLLATAGGIFGWTLFKKVQKHAILISQKKHGESFPSPLRGKISMVAMVASLASGSYFFYICRDSIFEVYGPWLLLFVITYSFSMALFHIHAFLQQRRSLTETKAPPLQRFRLLVVIGSLLFLSTCVNIGDYSTLVAPLALFQSILICALCVIGWWVLWYYSGLASLTQFKKIIRFGATMLFMLVLIVELSGYRNFSLFLLSGFFGTFLLAALLKMVLFSVNEIVGGFFSGKYHWQQRARLTIGISSDENLTGILWLGFIFKLLAWFTAFFLFLQLWGLSAAQRQEITSYLVNGLHLGGIIIAPARILLGIFIFACGWTLVAWVKMQMGNRWLRHTQVSRSVQETLVTATGYAGFALTLVIGLSIAGVGFSNLAVIAGALSVGIGFGLQNIVNNFVSGLIILFERPVKRGDWISVGNTEGYVQKISVRSTLIQTFDRSDVIVPNSELISNQVTNMMLNDRYGRLIVPIGVAYGSDTELVRTILLDIAKANDKVVTNGSAPAPQVLFLEFGDSSLNFELRCHLANIDERLIVKSEINYEIDRAFRKHNMSIPFPQRDLYIKELPSSTQNAESK